VLPAALLTASPQAAGPARRALSRLGFAEPAAAVANLHALTPTPRDAELLAPALPRLLAELGAAPDPDMALNNLERYASVVDRAVLFRTLAEHPGAAALLARVGGSSQMLADALRRRPSLLAWLLEPRTMRVWLAEDFAADLAQALAPFGTREARLNALRRFKYRQLLRIGARDLLGDADLTQTTEELSQLADACLGEAARMADAEARAAYGAPLDAEGREVGLAVIGMGKLGGRELNYSSDIDLMFVYGDDGETAGGPGGRLATGDYFARVCRDIVAMMEESTDEGYAFRVDLRLRPEGRMGAIALSLDGFRAYHADRAALWERQALLKARVAAGDEATGARFMEWARQVIYRPGIDAQIVPAIRAMKREIDRSLTDKGDGLARNVKLGRGGIREVEFIVQALELLYGGDDPWLREPGTLRALFRLTERGYLAPALGRTLSEAYVHLRTVEHRLQILHEFQTHTLPRESEALALLARRVGMQGTGAPAARDFQRRHRRVTSAVNRAFREFFGERAPRAATRLRLPSAMALSATGFVDPERARHNLRLLLEGRPLVPYAGALRRALERLLPSLLDALWKCPDPDEALNQFERFVSAAGPRAGLVEMLAADERLLEGLVRLCAGGDLLTQLLIAQPELLTSLAEPAALAAARGGQVLRAAFSGVFAPGLDVGARRDALRWQKQAEELRIVWRHLLGRTTIEGYAREMTELAEAALAAGWLLALDRLVRRHGVPRDERGQFIPAVIIGLGKLGGRELTTGSDLDLFVVFGADGHTEGPRVVDAHTFYSEAVEGLASALGDITAAGVAFPVDLRLRPGSKGSGFASSLAALQRYYAEYGDLWERQSLTRARLVLGDPRLGRAVQRVLRSLVYGSALGAAGIAEIRAVRTRMERELGKENPGRVSVKFGRGGLIDVEFLVQALQLAYGHRHAGVRSANTAAALAALARVCALPAEGAARLAEHHRFLRRVTTALRLLGARPTDTLELASPLPGRVATALGHPSRDAFLAEYRQRTAEVRALYTAVLETAARRLTAREVA
jgi:[glutamine synthetase] adenylyltransferase / [glutamine synthetase]-adenylyl-L-tyrosine phosphorylase